jgi:hypothetical protein
MKIIHIICFGLWSECGYFGKSIKGSPLHGLMIL